MHRYFSDFCLSVVMAKAIHMTKSSVSGPSKGHGSRKAWANWPYYSSHQKFPISEIPAMVEALCSWFSVLAAKSKGICRGTVGLSAAFDTGPFLSWGPLRPAPLPPIILMIPFLPPSSFSSMFLKLFSLLKCLLFNDCNLLDLGSQTSLSKNINKSCSFIAFQHLFSCFKISQRPSIFSQDLECKCSMKRHLNSTRRDGRSSYCSLSLGCSPASNVHSTLSI